MRIGIGFDVHRTVSNRRLVLGGVEIPSDFGLAGHSDADVILHAVMDAILGALSLGDIGTHFPDTDETYRGADSVELGRHVCGLMLKAGYRVGNLDIMVLAEAPKLAPHVRTIRENIAATFDCSSADVSVKATTMEGLGFIGQREGVAAQAVALLERNLAGRTEG